MEIIPQRHIAFLKHYVTIGCAYIFFGFARERQVSNHCSRAFRMASFYKCEPDARTSTCYTSWILRVSESLLWNQDDASNSNDSRTKCLPNDLVPYGKVPNRSILHRGVQSDANYLVDLYDITNGLGNEDEYSSKLRFCIGKGSLMDAAVAELRSKWIDEGKLKVSTESLAEITIYIARFGSTRPVTNSMILMIDLLS